MIIKFKTIAYDNKKNEIVILDQTRLPEEEVYVRLKTVDAVYQAIKSLQVRGAPLIGVAAAYGVVLACSKLKEPKKIIKAADFIKSARPTAVNLSGAIERMKKIFLNRDCTFSQRQSKAISDYQKLYEALLNEARKIEQEDKASCLKIGKVGACLIPNRSKIMVYCNAGALATSGIGTALGILYQAKAKGMQFTVYACETRPLLQGARLTTWELTKNGIKTYCISDNMAGAYLPEMDLVIVGADRITRNGDTANKIGTKGLAIIARHFNVPFYVAAPVSSFDLKMKSGRDIPIEYRNENEIRRFNYQTIVAKKTKILNPAFDVTPAELITAIITEKGIIRPPLHKNIVKIV